MHGWSNVEATSVLGTARTASTIVRADSVQSVMSHSRGGNDTTALEEARQGKRDGGRSDWNDLRAGKNDHTQKPRLIVNT
jgi:hypothetical protein